jgi:DNA-binding NarL/FixJ family response regulator
MLRGPPGTRMNQPSYPRRVVIVDDSLTIQALLENAFSTRKDFRVVGFAADAKSAAEIVRRLMPDIVTIDLCLPYIDGEALLGMISDLTSVCKIMVSDKAVDNGLLASRLIQAGARDCLAKSDLAKYPEHFFKAINKAADRTANDLRRYARTSRSGPDSTVADAVSAFDASANCDLRYPMPVDEERRLEFGKSKALFNGRKEPCFDLITKNASILTAFPVALLTFIDKDTQWIKSSFGLDVTSTPREQAFCNYTISQGGTFVVNDALNDERFRDHPLVLEAPNIRSYIGVPVIASDGPVIGALCIIDARARTASRHTIQQLGGLAEIAAAMIDMRPALAA